MGGGQRWAELLAEFHMLERATWDSAGGLGVAQCRSSANSRACFRRDARHWSKTLANACLKRTPRSRDQRSRAVTALFARRLRRGARHAHGASRPHTPFGRKALRERSALFIRRGPLPRGKREATALPAILAGIIASHPIQMLTSRRCQSERCNNSLLEIRPSPGERMLEAVPELRLLYSAHGKARFSLTSHPARGSLRDSAAESSRSIRLCGFVGSEYLRCEST
jgi:hypothetical protein